MNSFVNKDVFGSREIKREQIMTTLILNKQQATVLSIILEHIGGSTSKSGRKYADEIRRLLNEQGFYHSLDDEETYEVRELNKYVAGIWFEDTK